MRRQIFNYIMADLQLLKAKVARLKEMSIDTLGGNQNLLQIKIFSQPFRNQIDFIHNSIKQELDKTLEVMSARGVSPVEYCKMSSSNLNNSDELNQIQNRKAKISASLKENRSQINIKFKKYMQAKHMQQIKKELLERRDPEIEICREAVRKQLQESKDTDFNQNNFKLKTYNQLLSEYKYIFDDGQAPNWDRDVQVDKKYDIDVRTKQFQSLPKEPANPECISKQTLYRFLTDFKYTMVFYNIDPLNIKEEIDYLKTENKGLVTLSQFHQFLTQSRETVDYQRFLGRAKIIIKQRSSPFFIGDQSVVSMIDKIFEQINYFGEKEMSSKQLARKLGEQLKRHKMLDKQAIEIPKIQKKVYFNQILFEIENNLEAKVWSYDSFLEYLNNYQPLRVGDRYDLLQRLIIQGKCPNEKIVLLRKQQYELIKRVYEYCQKFQGSYVMTKHFIQFLENNQYFRLYQNIRIRDQPFWGIPAEDFKGVVARMAVEAQDFINFDQILDFFSQNGRPKHIFNQMHNNLFKKNIIIFNEDSFLSQKEDQITRAKSNPKRNQPIVTETIKKLREKSLNVNITVPIPFKLTKSNPKQTQSQPAPKAIPFKHKPIPDFCKSVNLYQHMRNQQERKRQMRKNQLKHETRMQKVKPFELTKSRNVVHCQIPAQHFQFKANPVPFSTSIPRYEQILKQKKMRKKILKEFTQNKNKNLPEYLSNMLARDYELKQRKKRYRHSENLDSLGNKLSKVATVPDFKALHLQFQRQLNQRKRKYFQAQTQTVKELQVYSRPRCNKSHYTPQKLEDIKRPNSAKANPSHHRLTIPTTAKYQAQVQKRRQTEQLREYAKRLDIMQSAQNQHRIKQMIPQMRSKLSKGIGKPQPKRKKRDQFSNNYRQFLDQMYDRVRNKALIST